MAKLSGKVALVTGASRGIGAAIAKRLAADGASVAVNYSRSEKEARDVVAAIEAAGGRAAAVHGDVADAGHIKAMFDAAEQALGKLDVLVNNAGVWDARPIDKVDADHYDKVFSVNVRGMVLAAAEAARRLPDGGRIINISSGLARGPMAGTAVYSASKGAIEAMTRAAAQDLGSRNITVNVVAPGTTETEMLTAALPDEVRKHLIGQTALGRLGQPDDIAAVVAFLASDDGRWVTGQAIDANGGLRM